MLFFRKTCVFAIYKNRLAEAILTNYTERMIHKNCSFIITVRYSCFRQVHIKFLYNSKFDLTARSLVTNSVVITRVFCICLSVQRKNFSKEADLEVRNLLSFTAHYFLSGGWVHIRDFPPFLQRRHFFDFPFAYLEDKTLCLYWSEFFVEPACG